jgi:hypothetical protein
MREGTNGKARLAPGFSLLSDLSLSGMSRALAFRSGMLVDGAPGFMWMEVVSTLPAGIQQSLVRRG